MEIILTDHGRKDIEKLDEKTKKRVYQKLDDLEKKKPNLIIILLNNVNRKIPSGLTTVSFLFKMLNKISFT